MKSILILLLFCPQVLLAKTIVEPSLSLNSGSYEGKALGGLFTSETDISASYMTLSAGLRYGITREYIHVTAVADGYLINLDSPNVDASTEFQGNIGVGLGYEWNIPLRTYIIIGVPFSSLEVSYYFTEKMMVGLRYNRMTVEFGGLDLNVNTYGLALSFPFEFDYPGHWWRKKDWE